MSVTVCLSKAALIRLKLRNFLINPFEHVFVLNHDVSLGNSSHLFG